MMDRASALIEALLQARAEAKTKQDYVRADLIRDRLAQLGIRVEDTADGVRWWRVTCSEL